MKNLIISVCLIAGLSGCSSLNVSPTSNLQSEVICIVTNTYANADFTAVFLNEIRSNGYKAKFIDEGQESECVITTTYFAAYNGAIYGKYLSQARLKVFKNNIKIGQAEYRTSKANLFKYGAQGTIASMVDELFPQI